MKFSVHEAFIFVFDQSHTTSESDASLEGLYTIAEKQGFNTIPWGQSGIRRSV